jgi:hypothetical protein
MEITMSTDFLTVKKIAVRDLFDGRLKEFGVREHVKPDETSKTRRCLTDGRNYVWVYVDDEGSVAMISRYGLANAPQKILRAIAEAFDTDIVSEYQPQFWGFDTQEEWDTAMEEMSREDDERLYTNIVKYVRGEPNDIRARTIGWFKAEIAKRLAEDDSTLLLPENKDRFLAEVNAIYERDHTVRVKLSDEQMAFARMLDTHEDDLPSA